MKPLSLVLVPALLLSACAPATSPTYQHFRKSIDYKNQATTIQNKQPGFEVIRKEDMMVIVDLTRQSLAEAKLVDIEQLNRDYKDFGIHYRDEFIRGLQSFLDGHDTIDNKQNIEGQILLDRWGAWYEQNIEGIRRAVR